MLSEAITENFLKEVAKSNENADLWSKSDFVGKLSEIEN